MERSKLDLWLARIDDDSRTMKTPEGHLSSTTAAHRLRFNAEKLILLSHELETFRSDSDYPHRVEQMRIAIANTLVELREVSDSLAGSDAKATPPSRARS
jgi:hypothetical protein